MKIPCSETGISRQRNHLHINQLNHIRLLSTMGTEEAENQNQDYAILALYQFVHPLLSEHELRSSKEGIERLLLECDARGTILLAPEGVNGTICFPSKHLKRVVEDLSSRFPPLRTRLSHHSEHVFLRLKVRVKSEIVSLKDASTQVNSQTIGEYVKPGPEWDTLIHDPDCLVVDVRNEYEYSCGTFENAENPHTESFHEFPSKVPEMIAQRAQKPKKIAMFCTGGIRCEKATAWTKQSLEELGEDIKVYHLEGGILAYLDKVPEEKSTFKGECYVFDQRTAVTHGLKKSSNLQSCHACRHVLTAEDRSSNHYQPGVACPYCVTEQTLRQRLRHSERQRHMEENDDPMHLQQQNCRKEAPRSS